MSVARNILVVSLLAGIGMLGSSCGTPTPKKLEASGRPALSAQELKTRLIGNSVRGRGQDAVPFTVYFPAYGEMRGVHSFHYKDTGKWSVTADNQFCGKWKNWWATGQRCWKIYSDGGDLFWMRPDGTSLERVAVERGNPEGL